MKLFKKENLFWNTLNIFEYLRYFHSGSSKNFYRLLESHFQSNKLFLSSSARGAIIVALKSLGIKRNDRVFIPPFLSSCIIDTVTSVGTPSLDFNKDTKAILLYHHWGFMQDIYSIKKYIGEHKVYIIEDCAHTFWGKIGDYEPGDFGDFSTFSLSKIFNITYCGLLRINREDLFDQASQILSKSISFSEYIEHIKGDFAYLSYYSSSIKSRDSYHLNLRLSKWYAYLLSSPTFKNVKGNIPKDLDSLESIFKDMNSKFIFLFNHIKNKEFILEYDVIEKMAPISYPLISEDYNLLKRIKFWLEKNNIFVDLYNFDIHRNMFNPLYKVCIPLPLYSGIDIQIYKKLICEFPEIN
tara:strand:- start:790 stop:1851 length:1062 start_codon:yes stop_codon:yes gene_type:complete